LKNEFSLTTENNPIEIILKAKGRRATGGLLIADTPLDQATQYSMLRLSYYVQQMSVQRWNNNDRETAFIGC
jgi:hypothetical protein